MYAMSRCYAEALKRPSRKAVRYEVRTNGTCSYYACVSAAAVHSLNDDFEFTASPCLNGLVFTGT